MIDYAFTYRWQIHSSSTPEQLWPVLSDTNRLFKDLGKLPVQKANLSQKVKKGHRELTYEPLHRIEMWEEEPYQWEAPYHLSVKRVYKSGYFKDLLFSIDITKRENGSIVTFRYRGVAKGLTGYLVSKRRFNSRFKYKLRKLVQMYDISIAEKVLPVDKKHRFTFKTPKRWEIHCERLSEISGKPDISKLLIQSLQHGNESELKQISPKRLAGLWDKPIHDVLHVMLFAVNIDLLNFYWKVLCPQCRSKIKNIKKLAEITDSVYCKDCDEDFNIDFHNALEISFQPHPLIRKLTHKTYCPGNPAEHPHINLHISLKPGQKRFVKMKLKKGTYKIYSDNSEEVVYARVDENGLDNATIHFNEQRQSRQQVRLSTDPNLIIHNQSANQVIVQCENLSRAEYAVSAAEVTSWQLFRNLFPRELIRNKKKLNARNLTILFTDLYNSSDMYRKDGDESALGVVMDHFDVLEKVIIEERGSVVKTIGDAVMAIFPKPAYAVRAFYKAERIFKENSKNTPSIDLKGGVHVGDCMTVTLNNRIDYFGNTVNIASRLVDFANGSEVVLSNEAQGCPDLKDFMNNSDNDLRFQTGEVTLKGFEDESFEILKLTRRKSALRLVI